MQFDPTGPDTFTARQHLGAMRWFGAPFALAALLPLAGAFGILPARSDDGSEAPAVLLVVFALPFLAIGLGMMFWRRRLVVDLREGTITRAGGVGFVRRGKVRELDAFDAVAHERRVIRTQKSSRVVYPVLLLARGEGGATFDLVNCRNRREARQAAEALAKVCKLAVVDRTDGEARRREHDQLDVSLREQRRRSGARHDPGEPPAGMRSTIAVHGDELEIAMPGFGWQPLLVVFMVLGTAPFWMTLLFASTVAGDAPAAFRGAMLAMGALPTLAVEAVMLHLVLRRHTLRASNRELRVQQHGLRRREVVMPADEIEELTLPDADRNRAMASLLGGGPPITVASDRELVAFGESLPRDEARYVADVLLGALSAG